MKEKICNALWKLFLFGYSLSLAAVIVLCVLESQDNLPAVRMAIYPLVGLLIVSVITLIGVKMEHFLDKYEKYLLPLFFILYTIATVRFTVHSRGIPVHDQKSLIAGAEYMAGLTEEMNWTYFGRWNHNIMPMVFLSFVFRAAKLLQIQDGYYLALALNIVQVLCVLYCVYKLGRRYSKHGSVSAWLGMGMMAVFIPIWGHTQSLYTDAFSFGFGIIAFYIWLCNYEKRKSGTKYWLINIAAGVIWGIGFEIKATVAIYLIAVILYLVLFEQWRVVLRNVMSLLAPVVLIATICSSYIQTLPSKDYADTWGVPPIGYFIGVGLEGNGGFDAYSEYFLGVTGEFGMEAKKDFSNAFILEHLDRFAVPDHMIAKLRHNFATGVMRADDFMSAAENNGFLYNCVSYGGAYRETYRTYVTAYWYMLLEWIVIACVLRGVMKWKKREKEDPAVFVPIMAVCGICVYVMIFEANNRQLYNHIPVIFCAANMGIWWTQSLIRRGYHKLRGE